MRCVAAFLACALAALCLASASAVILPNGCPLPDPLDYTVHQPHESDCSKFYKCDNGVKVLFDCPAGLDFNPSLWVCDWPEQAGCTSGSGTTEATPVPTEATTANPSVTCPGFATGNEQLPVPYNCTLYQTCVAGNIIINVCPPNQVFDNVLNACDWDCHATCVESGCPGFPEGTEVIPNPDDCHTWLTCEDNTIVVNPCPEEKNFDVNSLTCEWDCHAVCAQQVTTPLPTEGTVAPAVRGARRRLH